jgi:hypothetical protein
VTVKAAEGEGEGVMNESGLITPMRSKHVVACKFSTAYGYVDRGVREIIIANITNSEIKLKKNSTVAEFHPRDQSVYEVVQCDGSREGRKRFLRSNAMRSNAISGRGDAEGHVLSEVRTRIGRDGDSHIHHTHTSNTSNNMGDGSNQYNNNRGDDPCVMAGLVGESVVRWDASLFKTRKGTLDVVPSDVEDTESDPNAVEREEIAFAHPNGISEKDPLESVDLKELRQQRSEQDVKKLTDLLVKYKHLLSDGSLDFHTNPHVKHDTTAAITTTVEFPKIVARGTRCNPEETKAYMKAIGDKEKEGVIEPSRAPWCSNALLVRKDGKIRMVIDYRALNKVTVKDSYPMPRIQDVTDVLQGTHWLTSMDCVQAFHQIPMADERSRDLTTFRGPTGGLYRYRYMPMGLVNAMAIWSRFIDTAMAGMNDFVLCYADDLLVLRNLLEWKTT